jgi:hypothetical protein
MNFSAGPMTKRAAESQARRRAAPEVLDLPLAGAQIILYLKLIAE